MVARLPPIATSANSRSSPLDCRAFTGRQLRRQRHKCELTLRAVCAARKHSGGWRLLGGNGSRWCRLTGSQSEAGKEKLAVLRVSVGDDARYHYRGDLSQPLHGLSRFVQSPHMRKTGREETVADRNVGSLLQRRQQNPRRILKTATK